MQISLKYFYNKNICYYTVQIDFLFNNTFINTGWLKRLSYPPLAKYLSDILISLIESAL